MKMKIEEVQKRYDKLFAKGIFNLTDDEDKEFQKLAKILTDEDSTENIIFVYGSLRQGLYNFPIIEQSTASKFIAYGILEGYRMYSLGSYPAIHEHEGMRIYGEIWKVNDRVFNYIDRMEHSAGYGSLVREIQTSRGKINALFYFKEKSQNHIYINGGDWVKYLILDSQRQKKNQTRGNEK